MHFPKHVVFARDCVLVNFSGLSIIDCNLGRIMTSWEAMVINFEASSTILGS